jgi:hypothetical protein
MTAAELIAELSKHSPETPVCVAVEDECGCSPAADVTGVDRVVRADGTYLEIVGGL